MYFLVPFLFLTTKKCTFILNPMHCLLFYYLYIFFFKKKDYYLSNHNLVTFWFIAVLMDVGQIFSLLLHNIIKKNKRLKLDVENLED